MSTIWKVTINNEESVWMVSSLKPTGEELSKRLDVVQSYCNGYEGKKNSLKVETFEGFVIGGERNWCQKLSRAAFSEVAPESFLDGLPEDFRQPVILGLKRSLNFSISVSNAEFTQSLRDLVLSLDK